MQLATLSTSPLQFGWVHAGAFQKFHDSVWGKKLSRRKAKEGLTDFDRFKASRTHAKKGAAVRTKLEALKKQQS